MKAIAMFFVVLLMGGWAVLQHDDGDKLWDQGNRYYQADLYDDAVVYFKKALDAFERNGNEEMIKITHASLSYTYVWMEEWISAERHLDEIDHKVKLHDPEWARSISDLYGIFGMDKEQIMYLKRAKKYEKL